MGDSPVAENEELLNVATTLRLDDKISVIFLLSRDPDSSLHVLRALRCSESPAEENGLFRQFLLQLMVPDSSEVCISFKEALAVIQNYRAGRLLGYSKSEMMSFAGNVNPIRKELYLLADSLTEEETRDLVYHINKRSVQQCRYLEEAILEWQLGSAIDAGTDLDSSSLKTIRKYVKVHKEEPTHTTKESPGMGRDFYEIIDPFELGFCIVINNTAFTRNKDLEHLMPPHELPSRPGSERDVQEIEAVFTWLHFCVQAHQNVSYTHLRTLLASYAKSVQSHHSCIVLVFMSHGTEDVVYTADSVPVSVDALEMAFQRNSCPQLTGRPKILIIQACQGTALQRIQLDGNNRLSNLETLALGPERGDAFIAWSTVKGYASFRDRLSGSWFIQELCKELRKSAATRDLVDIVTRVNNHLRNKTLHGVFMVPSLSVSLCRKIMLLA